MTWLALLLPLTLPFLLSMAVALLQQASERLHPGAPLGRPAGRWLTEVAAREGVAVRVEVHPHAGIDAYWPGTGAIGLSQATFCAATPVAWAVAAHELGHAHTSARSRLLADLLPSARLAHTFSFRAFVAALLASLLFARPALLGLAGAMLAVALVASAVVLLDEAQASRFGLALLRREGLPAEALAVARRSMVGAFGVYAAGSVGDVAALFTLPAAAELLDGRSPPPLPAEAWAPGVWLFLALVPVLALRAAHLLHQLLRPEPVTSDFRLFTVMQRESQWEFLTGVGVVWLVLGLHDHGQGALFELATVLAVTTAVGPVGGLLRAAVLVPVLVGLGSWGLLSDDDNPPLLLPEARGGDAAPALMALYSAPPWYLRVSWAAHLAYLPFLLSLGAQLAAR